MNIDFKRLGSIAGGAGAGMLGVTVGFRKNLGKATTPLYIISALLLLGGIGMNQIKPKLKDTGADKGSEQSEPRTTGK